MFVLDEIPQICEELAASGGVTSTIRLPDQSRRRRAFMAANDLSPLGEDTQSKTEIWKPVPSEPGVLASSWGRILLAPRYAPMTNGGYRAYHPAPRYGSISRASAKAKHEFLLVMVRSADVCAKQRPRKVHQLVCEAFHGPKPFDGAVVIHVNENALDNRPENLRWGTQKENLNMPKFKAWLRSQERNDNIRAKRNAA